MLNKKKEELGKADREVYGGGKEDGYIALEMSGVIDKCKTFAIYSNIQFS
jgi:hypothetical protein